MSQVVRCGPELGRMARKIGQESKMTEQTSIGTKADEIVLADTLGRPLQDLRISLLDRCNFRCPYCMPEAEYNEDYQFLSKSARLSHDEIFRLAAIAVNLGVTKLRITGGEPLLDKNVASLIERMATLPGVDDLALTTNGALLAPLAQKLADAGLQRVTISLDSLDEQIFSVMSGARGNIARVLEEIGRASCRERV